MSPKQVISQSFIGVLAKIPTGSCLFQLKNKKPNNTPNLYQLFWSDWQNRTLDRKSVSEILKKGPLFSNRVRQTKKKCIHQFVLMHVHKISNSGHYYSINMLECIHVSLCTNDLTGFNYSLSVNPVLDVVVCVVCVCVLCVHACVCVYNMKFLIQATINMLECIHVSLCTNDLTGFNYSLSVNPVLDVVVCVDVCVCIVCAHMCVCVCGGGGERERETH